MQHYIKACVESEVLYVQANYRWLIDYKELVLIFDAINRQYEGIFLRPYLLEMKSFPNVSNYSEIISALPCLTC